MCGTLHVCVCVCVCVIQVLVIPHLGSRCCSPPLTTVMWIWEAGYAWTLGLTAVGRMSLKTSRKEYDAGCGVIVWCLMLIHVCMCSTFLFIVPPHPPPPISNLSEVKGAVKVTVKLQNVHDFLSRQYLLNRLTFYYQTWYDNSSLWAWRSCKKSFSLRSRSQWRLIWSKYDLLYLLHCWPFATRLSLMAHHHKLDWLVKILDCCTVFKVKLTAMIQNFNARWSGWYLLNFWTSCNQTWYSDASSWASVSSKKIFLLFSRSRSQWRLI